jgi:Domain of unknown function (DUF4124)
MLRRLSIAVVVLAGAFTIARADVYRWVDEHGEAHYSDQWIPGAEVIKTARLHPQGTAAETTSRTAQQKSVNAINDRADAQQRDQNNTRAVQQDLASKRAVQCKQATAAYNQAITARVVYKDGNDGQRTYLSEADADKYRQQVRQAVQESCGSVPQFDPNAPIPEPQPIDVKPIPEPKVNPAEATSE